MIRINLLKDQFNRYAGYASAAVLGPGSGSLWRIRVYTYPAETFYRIIKTKPLETVKRKN